MTVNDQVHHPESNGSRCCRGTVGDWLVCWVPGDVPVKQFWSVTIYGHATCALIRNVGVMRNGSHVGKAVLDIYLALIAKPMRDITSEKDIR
jgi:hypothetical protein